MNSIQRKDATIAYEETGTGSPVLFLHCSSASHKEWMFAARQLTARHRCLLPDLMGYGKTSSQFDEHGQVTDCRDIDVIDAIVDLAGAPVDIVAHSYGAAAAIEFVSKRPEIVRSLLAVEPVSFQYLNNDSYREEWRKVRRLADNVIRAYKSGSPGLAASYYMSFWIGRLRWMLAPRKFRKNVVRTVGKVAYEFSQIYELPRSSTPLHELDFPVTFVTGSRTRREAMAVTEVLCHAFPRTTNRTISGAGHMSPFTHSQQLFGLVQEHLSDRPPQPVTSD